MKRNWPFWLAFGLLTLAAGLAFAQVTSITQTTFAALTAARLSGSGTAPSCSSTGLGTGSAAIGAGSTDLSGSCILSPTGAPAALGTMTLTFTTGSGAYGGNSGPPCVVSLGISDNFWNVRGTVFQATLSTTAPTFLWDNNTVALAATKVYHINYVCIGR